MGETDKGGTCRYCKEPIPDEAVLCSRCNRYQAWRPRVWDPNFLLPVLVLVLAIFQFLFAVGERSRAQDAVDRLEYLQRDLIRIVHLESAGRYGENLHDPTIKKIVDEMAVLAVPDDEERERFLQQIEALIRSSDE